MNVPFWLRGKRGGLLAFLAIAALVAGGLGWVTAETLHLERERLQARADAEAREKLRDQLRLALWRMDGLVALALGKENNRPYNHYSALYAPAWPLRPDGGAWEPGSVLEASPLLDSELPPWMLVHFQSDPEDGWQSPQVLSPTLLQRLQVTRPRETLANVTPERLALLARLKRDLGPARLIARVEERGAELVLQDVTLDLANAAPNEPPLSQVPTPPLGNDPASRQQVVAPPRQNLGANNTVALGNNYTQAPQSADAQLNREFNLRLRAGQVGQAGGRGQAPAKQQESERDVIDANLRRNGEGWLTRGAPRRARSEPVSVSLGPLTPLWVPAASGGEYLLAARLVQVGERQLCQGIVLDGDQLRESLTREVVDLFPEARVEPLRDPGEAPLDLAMTALPFRLDPGPLTVPVPETGWTPLRGGLALAWVAALVALLAVGLGGWSLLDLSERRIRFVSAVTHELRTPLTTLRLYLDMLVGGMVKEEKQKEEYLHTLNAEAERLNRLVGNVLDFSRLENQRPRPARGRVAVAELLDQVRATWQGRCRDGGKELVFDNALGGGAWLHTDGQLVQQILGNLIDNACKYSRGAADPRVLIRVTPCGRRAAFAVEDFGPGVPARERGSVFRPFRRGRGADVTAGGVGLGLALARRWAGLLGGQLTLARGAESGACFRLELPAA